MFMICPVFFLLPYLGFLRDPGSFLRYGFFFCGVFFFFGISAVSWYQCRGTTNVALPR